MLADITSSTENNSANPKGKYNLYQESSAMRKDTKLKQSQESNIDFFNKLDNHTKHDIYEKLLNTVERDPTHISANDFIEIIQGLKNTAIEASNLELYNTYLELSSITESLEFGLREGGLKGDEPMNMLAYFESRYNHSAELAKSDSNYTETKIYQQQTLKALKDYFINDGWKEFKDSALEILQGNNESFSEECS
jgi:hypothetical protein